MTAFMILTDSSGEDCVIRKENVMGCWEDHCTEGNPPAIVLGSRILLTTGGTIFVKERAAEVGRLLEEVT